MYWGKEKNSIEVLCVLKNKTKNQRERRHKGGHRVESTGEENMGREREERGRMRKSYGEIEMNI